MCKKIKFIIVAAFVGVLAFSCAKEESESNTSIQKRVLEAYLQVLKKEHPDTNYTITKSGLVVFDKRGGSGSSPEENGAAYLKYSVKDLSGNYQSTMFKDVAEVLGTYSEANYYGPQISTIGYGDITEGMSEALRMMNKGSKMTIIVPPHLSVSDSPDNYGYGYTTDKSETSNINLIYEIEMFDVVSNLQRYQLDSLESFRDINYPGLDSTLNMFYFKKLSGTVTDTIEDGKTANVWYVGRLLDGYVFDTNIADTAKKYGLYTSEKSYEALSVTYTSDYEGMASNPGSINVAGATSSNSSTSGDSDSEGSYVPGFAKALKCMTYGDRAITFFGSGWGYGSTSSMSGGSGVPSYSMLYFDLYVEEPED